MVNALLLAFILFYSGLAFASSNETFFKQNLRYDGPWTYKNSTVYPEKSDQSWNEHQLAAIRGFEPLAEVFPLLPDRFALKMAGGGRLRTLIDGAHLAIVQTPTGQHLCETATGGNLFALDELFGIQGPMARTFQSLCSPTTSRLKTATARRNYSTSRQFGFVFYDGKPPAFGSWTGKLNYTLIAIGPESKTEEHVIRTLVHELAVKMDDKTSLAINKNLHPFYTGPKTCEVMLALRNPFVRHSFTTIRALKVEAQILKEMNIPTNAPIQGTCRDRFLQTLKAVLPLASVFDSDLSLHEQSLKKECAFVRGKAHNLDELIKLLDHTLVSDHGNRKSLCEFLSEPLMGNSKMTIYSNGPRPRIGDGTGATPDLETLQSEVYVKLRNYSERASSQPRGVKPLLLYPSAPMTIEAQ